MRNFKNLGEFDSYLKNVIKQENLHKKAILEVAAQYIEDEAKRKFGVYQDAAGSYKAWAPLADSTMEQRARQGYEPNNPLYRSGDLMHSIHHVVIQEGNITKAVIGSNEDIMVYQELGTATIPARAVLGPAAFENTKVITKIIKQGISNWLLMKAPISKVIK